MSNALTDNLINIILAALLVIVIVIGLFFFFKDYIVDFVKNLFGGEEEVQSLVLYLVK